jgi:hypothetical protein
VSLKRTTPLARTGRLPRRTRMAAKNAKRGGHRFPKGVNEGFREYVRGLPCCVPAMTPEVALSIIRGEPRPAKWLGCWPQSRIGVDVLRGLGMLGHMPISECAHVKSRGAGGKDAGNMVPMCMRHHRQQHAVGIKTFQAAYGIDLRAIAARVWADHRGDA